jgi:hypothetical protein
MASDAEILVTCTDADCSLKVRSPLLDLATLILLYEDDEIPGYEDAKANKRAVPCPACARAGREGILVYLDDHLRKAPPDKRATVPAVFDAMVSVWKRAVEALTVTGQAADYQPAKTGPAVAHRLSVRPYDGHLLRPGNSDVERQYGDSEPGVDTKSMHVRQLKRDLLYLAYYGNRERNIAGKYGGAHVFEASLVGAILAFKFDISFFYGVPTTTDLAQSMVSDEELRRTTLESLSKPIYFDPKLPDNPIKPIAQRLIYPLADRLRALAAARSSYDKGIALHEQSKSAELTARKAAALREKALSALRAGMRKLPEEAPALDLSGIKTVKAERKVRPLAEVIAHPQFEQIPRADPRLDPWVDFISDLEIALACDPEPEAKRLVALEQLLAAIEDDELKKKFKSPIDRYKLHASAVAAATKEQLEELRKIVGGLPETFKPYREALHRYAVVDHATALYIQAILSQVPIGSSSGKIKQPGRKLAYRFPVHIEDEPETLDDYADLVIEACKKGGKLEIPPFIMLERQKNESGYRATDKVGDLATSKDERARRVPVNGIDWSNWGRHGGAVTKYAYSELFTNSVGRAQDLPGYFGPIVHSRGVGGGQVSWPTLMRGVSPDGRAGEVDGYEWIAGIPVPKDGKMPTPEHWTGARGSCARSVRLLESKFTPEIARQKPARNCTFGKVQGGKRYECDKCLERFQLGEKQKPLLAPNKGGDSYHCSAGASRWPELFGEPLSEDSEAGRTEYPCSWLRAVMRYAGTGPRADARLFKTAREIVAVGKVARGETSEEAEETPAPDAGKKGKKPKAKKPKKKSEVLLAMEAAFERARKQL